MKSYVRRADYGDMSFDLKLGILIHEYENVAETEREKADALAAVERMKTVIAERTPRAAPEGGMTANPQHDLYQGT